MLVSTKSLALNVKLNLIVIAHGMDKNGQVFGVGKHPFIDPMEKYDAIMEAAMQTHQWVELVLDPVLE